MKNSFHGRTIATLTACGQDSLHEDFGPFLDGFVYAEPDNFNDVKRLAEETNPCAIMMELVQGEGGVHALDKEFVKRQLLMPKNMIYSSSLMKSRPAMAEQGHSIAI